MTVNPGKFTIVPVINKISESKRKYKLTLDNNIFSDKWIFDNTPNARITLLCATILEYSYNHSNYSIWNDYLDRCKYIKPESLYKDLTKEIDINRNNIITFCKGQELKFLNSLGYGKIDTKKWLKVLDDKFFQNPALHIIGLRHIAKFLKWDNESCSGNIEKIRKFIEGKIDINGSETFSEIKIEYNICESHF